MASSLPWGRVVAPFVSSAIELAKKVRTETSPHDIHYAMKIFNAKLDEVANDLKLLKATQTEGRTSSATTGWNRVRSYAQAGPVAGPPPSHPPTQPASSATLSSANTPISTATPAKTREVIVKIGEKGKQQELGAQTPDQIRRRVNLHLQAFQGPAGGRQVAAALQLKSGDVALTTRNAQDAETLRRNPGWEKTPFGCTAHVQVPTYGIVVHGITVSTIKIDDLESTASQLKAENAPIQDAEISYIGWLTRESRKKHASSAVIEFALPQHANDAIYASIVWHGKVHATTRYDRACRLKQCFRCYKYGHIGLQCSAEQVCGYCGEPHETKSCPQRHGKDFQPKCAGCRGAHTAWSKACPSRKKEEARPGRRKPRQPHIGRCPQQQAPDQRPRRFRARSLWSVTS